MRVLTNADLDDIETEIDQINSEMDWRCPDREWRWFEWADARLHYLLEVLEGSYKLARIRESGLRVVRGGASCAS